MKSIFIKAFLYVKSNLFACACFFWAIMIFLIGSFSYARFISSEPVRSLPQAGSFVCSANIDGVSSLSFTNTAFWGGTLTNDRVAMSALRSIDFTVNNFKMVGDKKVVNEVKTSYSLSFSAPANFVQRLALQPFKFDELGDEHPLLPQIVINDIMHAGDIGKSYNTGDSEDYQGVDVYEMNFEIEKSGNGNIADYIATAYDTKGNVEAQIRLEHFRKEVPQKLLFRMWDVSHLTTTQQPSMNTESGKLLPPLEITATQTIDYYKIIISIPGVLVMPAAVETTYNHSVHLTPTHTITDDHLAGYFVNYNENGVKSAVTQIYADSDKQWTVERVEEGHVGKFYYDEALTQPIPVSDTNKEQLTHVHEFNVMDSYTIYNENETILGKPVTFTEVLEGQKGNWKEASSETVTSTIDAQSDIRLTKSGNNWSESNSNNPDYKASVSVVKTTTTSYSAMTVGTLTREVTETEDIYVLGTKEGYTKPTLEKVYLRVKYSDTISSAAVTGSVTKTVVTTYTYNITMQKKGNGWWGNNYSNYNPDDDERQAILELLYGELLTNSSVETTEDVSVDLGQSSSVRYQLRDITRNILRSTMTIDNIKWVTFDGNGNTAVDANGSIIYQNFDESSPLKLYGDDGLQDYYLSPCYSKNYPFYVDVIFEQIQ